MCIVVCCLPSAEAVLTKLLIAIVPPDDGEAKVTFGGVVISRYDASILFVGG